MKKQTKTAKASFEVFAVKVRKLRDAIVAGLSKDAARVWKAIKTAAKWVGEYVESQSQFNYKLLLTPLTIYRDETGKDQGMVILVFGFRVFFLAKIVAKRPTLEESAKAFAMINSLSEKAIMKKPAKAKPATAPEAGA